jgi:DNA-binding CsgD family transcriptional regulator
MIVLADVLGEEDPRMEHMLGMQAVATHWGELPAREQEILRMDFRGGMTQAQIGQRLRMSQMQVSRLRSHALGYLRSRLLDLEGTSAAQRPRVVATGANRLCRRPGAWSCASFVFPLRRAVTTVRSESKCFLPVPSKAQARHRRRFR